MKQLLTGFSLLLVLLTCVVCDAGTRTWDGKYDTSKIEVTVVYFVPSDRKPLKDWRDRIDYFCKRIEQFHAREFQGQSELQTVVHVEPLMSAFTTASLRQGDADAIFFRTVRESEKVLAFAEGERKAFPVLLVLSDINWQPLDDFYRLKPADGAFVFEGNETNGQHFPGATAGGARATYLADRGVGWGLVSADGWRVPYRGSDCVVYHEGCGHTVGLPHPEPGDNSVMSLAQYVGWISESFVNQEQKVRLGWEPKAVTEDKQSELFSTFTAIPEPIVPQPGEAAGLKLQWPNDAKVESLRVRFQTALDGPWMEAVQSWKGDAPDIATLGTFERETPVSYRVDAVLKDGATAELWGYLQVRQDKSRAPEPAVLPPDLMTTDRSQSLLLTGSRDLTGQEIDLLQLVDPATAWSEGEWTKEGGKLLSPNAHGARIELPYLPEGDYRVVAIVEPLDEPNGLIFGQRSDGQRFATLFSFSEGGRFLSAIENIDGQNVGNETTFTGALFRRNQLSQVTMSVRSKQITMSVDGHTIVNWQGSASQLSLSDYWKTPNDKTVFLGAYDCRYRFHRLTVEPLTSTDADQGTNRRK